MGMFVVNIMFSVGNVIPLNLYTTGNTPATCGRSVVSSTAGMVSLGLFFGGKYGMVLYELFIVSTSLMSLKTGRTETSRWVEMASHTLCVVVGLGLFLGWTIYWAPLSAKYWADEKATQTSADGNAPGTMLQQATEINDALNRTVTVLLRAWLALLSVVIVLWGWSRVVLHQLELEWDEALVSTRAQMDRDRKPPSATSETLACSSVWCVPGTFAMCLTLTM